MKLTDSVSVLSGVGAHRLAQLKRLEIKTIADLILHAPSRYLDMTKPQSIREIRAGEAVCSGKVQACEIVRTSRKGMSLLRATISDASGSISAVWFNQPFLVNSLKEGTRVTLQGKVVPRQGELVLQVAYWTTSPGIISIYPLTGNLSNKWLANLINQALRRISKVSENLPAEILAKNKLISREKALFQLHQPQTMAQARQARRRLAFEELFFTIFYLRRRRLRKMKERARPIPPQGKKLRKFVTALPFRLTNDQRVCAWQIINDLGKNFPANRILQGDVGSGKTIVACLGAISVAWANFQTIWVAPTTILARQHYQTLRKLLPPEISLGLFTSADKIRPHASIVVGTHALFFGKEAIDISKVAFVIVDEQHKFGVKQRGYFDSIKSGNYKPHFLSMTATPIPRSLALVFYSDLDISRIKELPKSRKPVISKLASPGDKGKLYNFIRKQLKKGRQAYIVAPAIEEIKLAGKELFPMKRKSVKTIYKEIKTNIFPNHKVGLLHGKLKPSQKEKTMKMFAEGKIDVLVSTSVIEVGIDVPSASIMVVEGAEFFGLAQLHQLRGRVGRGKYQSYCFFTSNKWTDETYNRLLKVANTTDGYALAQLDLKQRGPGQLAGFRQSGLPDFKIASFWDSHLLNGVQRAVEEIIKNGLEKYPTLSRVINQGEKKLHFE